MNLRRWNSNAEQGRPVLTWSSGWGLQVDLQEDLQEDLQKDQSIDCQTIQVHKIISIQYSIILHYILCEHYTRENVTFKNTCYTKLLHAEEFFLSISVSCMTNSYLNINKNCRQLQNKNAPKRLIIKPSQRTGETKEGLVTLTVLIGLAAGTAELCWSPLFLLLFMFTTSNP